MMSPRILFRAAACGNVLLAKSCEGDRRQLEIITISCRALVKMACTASDRVPFSQMQPVSAKDIAAKPQN